MRTTSVRKSPEAAASIPNGSEGFWRHPPWIGGGRKQRLGLRPIDRACWFSTGAPGWQAHKTATLADHYHEAAATHRSSVEVDVEVEAEAALRRLGKVDGPYPDAIANFAINVPDDVCLVDVGDAQRLVAGCVCSPSYWRLIDKIGLPLSDVHAPVPGMNAKIGDAITRFVERAPLLQPFERRNWFLHADGAPFHLEPESVISSPVAEWYVRSERQTLCRIAERYTLFTIFVTCHPLSQIRSHPLALEDLLKALRAMDVDEVEHFGGRTKQRRLIEQLVEWSES